MAGSELRSVQSRILDAAAELFSNLGYHGVSTKEIARLAEVNESSIFRYYPNKRSLFLAALDAEFARVRLRADLLARLAAAPDAQTALAALFRAIGDAVLQHGVLVRLIHFSVLDFGEDLNEIFDRHVRGTMRVVSEYMARWPELSQSPGYDTRIGIVSFIATVVAMKDFYPVLTDRRETPQALENTVTFCTELWCNALAKHAAFSAKA